MNLTVNNPSDLTAWFEQDPGPWYGERPTMLDDRRTVEKVIHSSEIPLDRLFSMPEPMTSFDTDDFDCFNLHDFELTH